MHRFAIAVIFAWDLWDLTAAQNDCRPKDCYDLKCYKVSKAKDGPHTIYPDTTALTSLQVSCDQETDGGGWIVFLRRLDGTVNFTRNWDAYKRGFGQNGDNMSEVWLGNENVYQVLQSYGTPGPQFELRIEMDAFDESKRWVVASNFRMNDENSKYTLNWDSVDGPYPELDEDVNFHKLQTFVTIDNVNEFCIDPNLKPQLKGGWWFNKPCFKMYLTGVYYHTKRITYKSITAIHFKGPVPLRRARMMFRPTNASRICNNPCKNGGICEHAADNLGHHCVCTSEWCGATCEVVNPCKNSATCEAVEDPTGHHCACMSEWCGPTCEVANPCKNEGNCEGAEYPLGPHCACTSEWCGPTCEVVNPCKNEGECQGAEYPLGPYCACTSEWCGPTCEVANPCKNEGNCEGAEDHLGPHCACTSEWCGPTCEVANPCKNEGNCEGAEDPLGPYCACKSEWCGPTCEVVNPCKNEGNCEGAEYPLGPYCACTSEWCGPTCEVANPCKNEGNCEGAEDHLGPHCACTSEWCGPTCEVANPCKNEGNCEGAEDPLGPYCACKSEWCGPTCEVANPCNNGGTCEADATTETTTCKCVAEFTGMTCENVTLMYTTGEDTTREDASRENTTGEDTTRGETTRGDVTRQHMTGDDTTSEDTTSDGTTGGDEGPAAAEAFRISSAAFHTTNCGVIAALLILRRRLIGLFECWCCVPQRNNAGIQHPLSVGSCRTWLTSSPC